MEKNDHDLLIRIDTRLEDLVRENRDTKKEVGSLKDTKCDKKDVDKKFDDFENRMRRMERIIYTAIGGLAILQIVLSFVKLK